MARQARQISKSGNYYIQLRGEELFVTDEDKATFRDIAEDKFELGKVYGIEIGKKEIRMAVKEPPVGISMAMKSLATVYARYFNVANEREGKLFLGRFKSAPLESKKELDECVKGLKSFAPAKKESVKKTVETKKKAVKKAEVKKIKVEEEKPPVKQAQKSLPSWLL